MEEPVQEASRDFHSWTMGDKCLASISSTFYVCIFCTNVLCAAFLWLHFGFIIFWQKDIGGKSGRKMLMKLTSACFCLFLESIQSMEYCKTFCIKILNSPNYIHLKKGEGSSAVQITAINLSRSASLYCLKKIICLKF